MAVTAGTVPSTKMDALAVIDASGVLPRQRYQHYNNHQVYTVVAVGVAKASLEPTVGYAGPDGVVWFTPLSMFVGRAKQGAALVPRFVLCED